MTPALAGAGLFRKPDPTPDQVRGRPFRDHALATPSPGGGDHRTNVTRGAVDARQLGLAGGLCDPGAPLPVVWRRSSIRSAMASLHACDTSERWSRKQSRMRPPPGWTEPHSVL